MIRIAVLSAAGDPLAKGCWMCGPTEEVPMALTIACSAVQTGRPKSGVAIIIRRES